MKKSRKAMCLLLSAVLLLPVWTPALGEETEPAESRIIVSLGDSYSSGEGITPFYHQEEPDSEKEQKVDWVTHKSRLAWPGMLSLPAVDRMSDHRDTGNWYFVASSGAETKDLNGEQRKDVFRTTIASYNVYKQLDIFDQLGDGRKADYVTITIGGNDADFSGIVKTAAMHCSYLNPNSLSDQVNGVWGHFYEEGGIRDSLRKAYHDIEDRAGKQAAIIVAGYPGLLAENGSLLLFDRNEARYLNSQVSKFNNEIRALVAECYREGMNIYFVSVEEAFYGHEAYSDDPYINGVMLIQSEDINRRNPVSMYSVHPNEKGARAYANCVQRTIDYLEERKRAGEERPEYNPDIGDVEAQIIANAQKLLEESFPEMYRDMNGYIRYINNKKSYYQQSFFGAEMFNRAYRFAVEWSARWIGLLTDILIGNIQGTFSTAQGTGQALKNTVRVVDRTYISLTLDAVKNELIGTNPDELIPAISVSAVDSITFEELFEIGDRMTDGKFTSFEDAASFIRIFQTNRACLAAAEMGRGYYLDALNRTPLDHLANIAWEFIANHLGGIAGNALIGDFATRLAAKTAYKIGASAFHKLFDMIGQIYSNRHVRKWVEEIYAIEMDTKHLFLQTSELNMSFLARYLSEIFPSSFERYEANEGDTCVFNLDRQGLPGIDNEYCRYGNEGVNGEIYMNGFEVWMARWNYEDEKSWVRTEYILNGNYRHLSGRTGLIRSYNTDHFDTTIFFMDGTRVLASYRMTPGSCDHEISVDLTGVQRLTLYVKDNIAASGGTSFALSDLALTGAGEIPPDNIYDREEEQTDGMSGRKAFDGIRVSVSPEKYTPGETITIRAEAEGGTPDYTFELYEGPDLRYRPEGTPLDVFTGSGREYSYEYMVPEDAEDEICLTVFISNRISLAAGEVRVQKAPKRSPDGKQYYRVLRTCQIRFDPSPDSGGMYGAYAIAGNIVEGTDQGNGFAFIIHKDGYLYWPGYVEMENLEPVDPP